MIELTIENEKGITLRRKLGNGVFSMGKSPSSDIVLEDAFVSRHHADLIVSDSTVSIKDLDSTNGIWSGKNRIKGLYVLKESDVMRIGSLRIRARKTGREEAVVREQKLSEPDRKQDTNVVSLLQDDEEEYLLRKRVHELVLEHLDMHKRAVMHAMSSQELRDEAYKSAKAVILKNKMKLPKNRSEDEIIKEIVAEAIGLGPLEPLLQDSAITEIMVNGPQDIYVEKSGRIQKTDTHFNDNHSLLSIIERIVTPLGRRIDEGSPMVDARLQDGSRVNAIIPPLALNGPTVTIRKFSNRRFGINDLISNKTLSPDMAAFLEVCVRNRKNIVVSGGTGSGKTTSLNILSNFIPSDERIVTIEDAAELQLHQDHVVSLESRPANVEGKGLVSIRDLVKNSLRMRPDRIVVGECRGGEALDMLQAMNTGHDGSLTTGHANSPRDFLSRLEVMVLMSGLDLPVRAIREQIASAVDIIIQQTRFSDGKRRITSIVEVDGMEGDVILLQKIFEYRKKGRDENGNIIGDFVGCGYAPSFYHELEEAGETLDRSIFGENEKLRQDIPSWER